MPDTKQKKMTKTTTPVQCNDGLDLEQEIELGLRAIAEKARQGDAQALKLLMAYKEDKRGTDNEPDFRDLTELERKRLEEIITKKIISLRGNGDRIEDS